MLFKDLNLSEPILKAVIEQGYTVPTPIQSQAIPLVLEGRDVLGIAQTGTGKTAAFAIPVLQMLSKKAPTPGVKALILTPTRELATQIAESLDAYGKYLKLKHVVIFGGVSQHWQVQSLKRGVDIIVATPGRLLDLMNQGFISLSKIETLVLDEADRMLDMGFVNDIKKIITKLPTQRQTIFFSATMPVEIKSLVASILNQPVKIEVAPVSSAAETINQMVYFVEKGDKNALLRHIIHNDEAPNVLVFTRTKNGADKVAKDLNKNGIFAEAIHGNKSQSARQKALTNFKKKTTRVLVATDIASRGIDVSDLGMVINFELPECPETYIHRIGRTGRAGTKGTALSFCDTDERGSFKDIKKLPNIRIETVTAHPFESKVSATAIFATPSRPKSSNSFRSRDDSKRTRIRKSF